MIPSEKLRMIIEEKTGLPLSKFAWDDELKHRIFSIQTDKDLEQHVHNLEEAYINGFNIGHCGTTSRYFSIAFKDARMHFGTLSIIAGSKSSTSGGHAWVEMDGFLLDPSLMILLPTNLKEEFGYKTAKIIAKDSSKMLSEYDLFEHEYQFLQNNPEDFENSLYQLLDSEIKRG